MELRSGGASLGGRYNSRSTILSTTPDEQGSASLEEEDSGVSEERRVLKQSPEQAHLLLTTSYSQYVNGEYSGTDKIPKGISNHVIESPPGEIVELQCDPITDSIPAC
jgi:hypothetical protein